MLLLTTVAFVSGIVTILSPCILPVLPAILAGGSSGGRARPFGIILGFSAGFTLLTVAVTALADAAGIGPNALRIAGVVVLAGFGTVMIVPGLSERFERAVSGLVARFNPAGAASGPRRDERADGAGAAGAGGDGAAPRRGERATLLDGRDSTDAGSGAGNSGREHPRRSRKGGFLGGIVIGLSLGVLWTPCAGPILASVIGLSLAGTPDAGNFLIAFAYSVGTAVPMLAIVLLGRRIASALKGAARAGAVVRRVFGAFMILTAAAVGFGWDIRFQTAVLQAFPAYGSNLTGIESLPAVTEALRNREESVLAAAGAENAGSNGETDAHGAPSASGDPLFDGSEVSDRAGMMGDYGRAPGFEAAGPWLNSEPLSLEGLRGRVVLVDFWTYSCVNCIRTLPYLRTWHETLRDHGLTIVGVHAPEFAFERRIENVERAVGELGVSWPVVLDNTYALWRAYDNRFWPAHFLIDARGRVRFFTFGEGGYRTIELAIRTLLAEAGYSPPPLPSSDRQDPAARTPEIYTGVSRAEYYTGSPALELGEGTYGYSVEAPGSASGAPGSASGAPGSVSGATGSVSGATGSAVPSWSLSGSWFVGPEYARAAAPITQPAAQPTGTSRLSLRFDARTVYAVLAGPDGGTGTVRVRVDDGDRIIEERIIEVGPGRLYELAAFGHSAVRRIELEFSEGTSIYSFTFGG